MLYHVIICKGEGEIFLNIKSALSVMVIEGMVTVPKYFHPSSTAGGTTLFPFSPYASLIMPIMWHISWLIFLSLDATVLFRMYMDEIVFINSDIYK